MKRGEILKTVYLSGTREAGMAALEKGAELAACDLNALANAYGPDLPLLVACIKGSMPHWERHLGEHGMALCRKILSDMVTVDASELRQAGE